MGRGVGRAGGAVAPARSTKREGPRAPGPGQAEGQQPFCQTNPSPVKRGLGSLWTPTSESPIRLAQIPIPGPALGLRARLSQGQVGNLCTVIPTVSAVRVRGPRHKGRQQPWGRHQGTPQKREICFAPGLGQLQKSQRPGGATAREAAAPKPHCGPPGPAAEALPWEWHGHDC